MAQYISKDALVTEIEKLMNRYDSEYDKDSTEVKAAKGNVCHEILCTIDSLEAKEMTNIELLNVKGFLVTDKDNYTAIYSTKPNRGRTEWVDGNHPRNANESSCLITLNNARLLPDIEFNDKPIEVEVVIKAQKGK